MIRSLRVEPRLLGAGLLAGSVALVMLLATEPEERTEILVMAANGAAGVRLDELTVATRSVIDVQGLVLASEADRYRAHRLAAPLDDGAPIPESLLTDPTHPGPDLVGLAMEGAAAVHGWLRAGDLADVYVIAGDEAVLVASGVPVVMAETGSTSLGSGQTRVVLAVQHETVAPLVAASSASLHLVRRGG